MRSLKLGEMFTPDEFKEMDGVKQRQAIAAMYKALNVMDASTVYWWLGEYAYDLLDETSPLVAAFDVWYVVTKVYDVSAPFEVLECIAEGESPTHWRRMINRHGFPWNTATRKELAELGA